MEVIIVVIAYFNLLEICFLINGGYMKQLILSMLVLGIHQLCFADNLSFYTVEIGKNIDEYPTCKYPDYQSNPTCKRSESEKITNRAVIDISHTIRPAWQQGGVGTILNDERRIRSFFLYTNGAAGQNKIFNELKLAYGKPRELKYNNLTNMYGVKVKALNATWVLKDGTAIWFKGVLENEDGSFSLDKGKIMFDKSI